MGLWNPAGSGQIALRLKGVQSVWPPGVRVMQGSRASYWPSLPGPLWAESPATNKDSEPLPVQPVNQATSLSVCSGNSSCLLEQGHCLETFAWV